MYVIMLATMTKKVLSSNKYNFINFFEHPINWTELTTKIVHRTTVMIMKVKYMYFLFSYETSLNSKDRNIVMSSHRTTIMYMGKGWCILGLACLD